MGFPDPRRRRGRLARRIAAGLLTALGTGGPTELSAAQGVTVTTSTSGNVTPSTVASVTSSTEDYLGAQFVNCTYDIVLPDGGAYSSFAFAAWGVSAFDHSLDGCDLVAAPGLETSTLEQKFSHEFMLDGVSAAFAPGQRLLRCNGMTLVSRSDDPTSIGFTEIDAYGLSARDLDGVVVKPPRLCATNIDCDSEPWGLFRWKGEPRCGDANYDGDVEAVDSLAALRTAVGTPFCVPVLSVCDANADGSVTATDALAILRNAVNQPVELSCPLPCNPGTVGPPGVDRYFEVEFSVTVDPAEPLVFNVTPAPGVVTRNQNSQCISDQGVASALHQDGSISGVMGASTAPGRILWCHHLRGVGDAFPSPSDFTIETRIKNGPVLDGAVRVSLVRAM